MKNLDDLGYKKVNSIFVDQFSSGADYTKIIIEHR